MVKRPKYMTSKGISALPEYRYKESLTGTMFTMTPTRMKHLLNKALNKYSMDEQLLVEDYLKILGLNKFYDLVEINLDLGQDYIWLGWSKEVHDSIHFDFFPTFNSKDEIIVNIIPSKTPEYIDVRDYSGVYRSYSDYLPVKYHK